MSVLPAVERGYAFRTNDFAGFGNDLGQSIKRSFSSDDDSDSDRNRAEERGEAARERAESRAGALRERVEGQRAHLHRDDWDPRKAGKVNLHIKGPLVRDGISLDGTIDRRRDQTLDVLRNGSRGTLTLPAAR